METVNVDPKAHAGEFSGVGLMVSGESVIKGKFKCNICGDENIDIEGVWPHFVRKHYDEFVKKEKERSPAIISDFVEDEMVCVCDDGVGDIFILPTYVPKETGDKKDGMIYDKAVTGLKDENIGRAIQKVIDKVGTTPDLIKVWRSKTGRVGFQLGFEDGL